MLVGGGVGWNSRVTGSSGGSASSPGCGPSSGRCRRDRRRCSWRERPGSARRPCGTPAYRSRGRAVIGCWPAGRRNRRPGSPMRRSATSSTSSSPSSPLRSSAPWTRRSSEPTSRALPRTSEPCRWRRWGFSGRWPRPARCSSPSTTSSGWTRRRRGGPGGRPGGRRGRRRRPHDGVRPGRQRTGGQGALGRSNLPGAHRHPEAGVGLRASPALGAGSSRGRRLTSRPARWSRAAPTSRGWRAARASARRSPPPARSSGTSG